MRMISSQVACYCTIQLLLIGGRPAPAGEAHFTGPRLQERSSLAQAAPLSSVRCYFQTIIPIPPRPSTCIAEYETPQFSRTATSCTGVESCSLKLAMAWPVRLWSPDSPINTKFYTVLPQSYRLGLFPRVAKITKGPWLSAATQQTVVVRWQTDRGASTWLRVSGPQLSPPGSPRWLEGTSSCPAGAAQPCLHTVVVSGLKAGSRYEYILGDVAPDPTTGRHAGGTFMTEPLVSGTTEFSFSVVGDIQGEGGNAWKDVANYTAALQGSTGRGGGPVLHTGDMAAINWNHFFSLGSAMLAGHPFYPARGNNDPTQEPESFLRFFADSGNTSPREQNPNPRSYYSLNYGNTHFIFLDYNILSSCAVPQAQWLREDLNGSGAKEAANIVVVAHWGPRGAGVYGDNSVLQSCLESLFADAGGAPTDLFRKLRVVLSGHQHYYTRISVPHTVGSITRKVHYVTVGSAGAGPRCPALTPSHGSGPPPKLEASSLAVCNPPDGTLNYQGIVVDVRDRVMELRAYNFAYDSTGKRYIKDPTKPWYTLLDCFAMDASGSSVTPQNSCTL